MHINAAGAFISRHFGLMMTGISASFASTRQRRRIGTHS